MKEIKNVFSAFDGMSNGQIALNRKGIKYKNYYASEVEPSSIKVTQHNFQNTIQVGDIREVVGNNFKDIDLFMGGSPCQDFSFAGKRVGMSTEDNIEVTTLEQYLELKQEGFEFKGQSYLFWEYIRLLKELQPKYFLLENVLMNEKWEKLITSIIGYEPIMIDSGLLSAQRRKRLYWTNIPNITQPDDKKLVIKDIIFDDSYKVFTDERIKLTKVKTKNYIKWDLSGKGYFSQQDRAYYKDGKMCTLMKGRADNKCNIVLDEEKDIYRRIHPIEAERAQTVPDNYTAIEKSFPKRLEMLGNGWTVDIIAHIFKGIE